MNAWSRVPVLLAIAASCGGTHGGDDPPSSPVAWERVTIRAAEGQKVVEGAVVVEAADGGLLLELADQRYETLDPGSIVSREPLPAPPAQTPRELGRCILAELPAGFDIHVTRHYAICFNTSRDYAKWAGGLFERLHDAFLASWRRAGLPVRDPGRPLVVVIFADRHDYEASASRDVGTGSKQVSGYYSFLTNRITTYDLTAADGLPRPAAGPAGSVSTSSPSRTPRDW